MRGQHITATYEGTGYVLRPVLSQTLNRSRAQLGGRVASTASVEASLVAANIEDLGDLQRVIGRRW